MDAAKTKGSEIVAVSVSVHPFASVMLTVYVAATTPVIEAVVAKVVELVEVDHAYVYVPVPPVAEAVTPPFESPLHVTLESIAVAAAKAAGSVMVTESTAVAPDPSETVTKYFPAASPFTLAVVPKVTELVEVVHA